MLKLRCGSDFWCCCSGGGWRCGDGIVDDMEFRPPDCWCAGAAGGASLSPDSLSELSDPELESDPDPCDEKEGACVRDGGLATSAGDAFNGAVVVNSGRGAGGAPAAGADASINGVIGLVLLTAALLVDSEEDDLDEEELVVPVEPAEAVEAVEAGAETVEAEETPVAANDTGLMMGFFGADLLFFSWMFDDIFSRVNSPVTLSTTRMHSFVQGRLPPLYTVLPPSCTWGTVTTHSLFFFTSTVDGLLVSIEAGLKSYLSV